MTNTPGSRGATRYTTESSSSTTRQYWRRANSPRPWWPWGILPLAGLLGTFLIGAVFVAPRIEADVRAEVQGRLNGQSFDSSIRSDGQGVAIRARAFERDRDYLDALARSTQCDTWVGRLTCPTSVQLALDEPPAAPAIAVVTAPPIVAAEPIAQAEAAGAIAVIDEGPTAADLCNDDFAAIMRESTIRFNTGNADINPDSNIVLSRLADVAKTCPGTIMIEGHTDSRGEAGMNLALSNSRAAAVRIALAELGVEPDRLVAEGFGETQPAADNETAVGRANNRRIVISVKQ